MQLFHVAHVRVRGAELVLVPVDPAFEKMPHPEQTAAAAELQKYAERGGLAGTAVPVWRGADGLMKFFARRSLGAVLETLSWRLVLRHVNYRLTVTRAAKAVPSSQEPGLRDARAGEPALTA